MPIAFATAVLVEVEICDLLRHARTKYERAFVARFLWRDSRKKRRMPPASHGVALCAKKQERPQRPPLRAHAYVTQE